MDVFNNVEQVADAPREPIEASHNHDVAGTQVVEQAIELRASAACSGYFLREDPAAPGRA
ncbi:hypothetical protein EMIT0111MI5_150005 [Burkholderia sp. IT-111MI5]